jgi:hypothetical protein
MSTPDRLTKQDADWIRLNVLPALWRDETEDLRTCVCQAPPSDWLGGIKEPAAHLWNHEGRTVADDRRLVVLWEVGRICRRRYPSPAATPAP